MSQYIGLLSERTTGWQVVAHPHAVLAELLRACCELVLNYSAVLQVAGLLLDYILSAEDAHQLLASSKGLQLLALENSELARIEPAARNSQTLYLVNAETAELFGRSNGRYIVKWRVGTLFATVTQLLL